MTLECHDIMADRFRNRSDKPAWHQIPNVWTADTEVRSASQVIAEIAGDLVIKTTPLQYTIDGLTYTSDSQFMVIRQPTNDDNCHRDLGVVGKNWKLHQYPEMAKVFDELAKRHPVETAGVMKQGALVFMSFKAGEWDVRGDAVESYFLANLSVQPGVAHKVIHTPVRVVCRNTNMMAAQRASINISIPHVADATQQMALAASLTEKFVEAQQETKKVCEGLADRAVTLDEALTIFEAAYPDPKPSARLRMLGQFEEAERRFRFSKDVDPNVMADMAMARDRFEQLLDRRLALRDACVARYAAFEPTDLAGTAWAAYNAVTEVADWREGRNAAESTLFGTRALEKERAWTAATTLIGASA